MINELSMDDWEAREARLAAKKAAKEKNKGDKASVVKKTRSKQTGDVKQIDTIASIVEDLKKHFLLNGKEVGDDDSIKRLQQFMRNTDATLAKKNMAGGSIFTYKNRFGGNNDRFNNLYDNVTAIRQPIMRIQYILKNTKTFDTQVLEKIKWLIQDLCEVLSNDVPDIIMQDETVKKEIAAGNPFFVGGTAGKGGNNVGFITILKQLKKDYKKGTYANIANRIEDFISTGKDAMSYRLRESKKTTIKESQLKQIIKESIIRVLNEGTMDNEIVDKWNQVEEKIGAQQMLDCIFQWVDEDTISQWLEWFEEEEWVSFENNEIDNEEF